MQVPGKLNGKQRKLLEELARSLDPNYGKDFVEEFEDTDVGSEERPSQDRLFADEEYDDHPDGKSDKDKGLFDRIKDALS